MAYLSHVPGQSRYFDHIYDPVFEVASKRDVWKANRQALHRSAPMECTSIYQTMFSDMPNRPGYVCWKRQNPLPYIGQPGFMTSKGAYTQGDGREKQICVIGACRCNFFHYPPDCVQNLKLKMNLPPECECMEPPKSRFENVGCQTIYRESSAQTRPYLPDYFISEGEPDTPEVIRVASLITGDQMPGEYEVRIIKRSRKRRQWEKELRATGNLNGLHERQTILETFEWEEFLAREQEIEEMQELRMQLLVNLMKKREATMRTTSSAKLKNASFRIEEDRKGKLKKLNNNYNRQLRKLELKNKNVSRKYHAENIVKEHTDQGSDLYAPQIRFGIHPKRLHFVPFKSSFQARLDRFENKIINAASLQCHVQKYDKLAAPKPAVTEIEKGFNNDKHLTKLYESLKALRVTSNVSKTVPVCLRRIHKEKILAAETPVGVSEDLYESSETHCCVYMQKILKGRATQKILYSGRDRCRGLIEEIQTTHMLSAVSAMYPGMSNETIRARLTVQSQQKQFTQKIQRDKQHNDIFRESEAGFLGVLLEFLEKELQRMYEQRKIHALCMLAERERMKREAAEAGRRQSENHRRQESEEIHRHKLKAAQDTVNMYLENLLMDETDKVAEDEARRKIQATARRIDEELSKSTDDKCQSFETNDNDNVVKDLVKHFMFPEVQKRIARKKTDEARYRHLMAAHESLYGHVQNICYNPVPRSSKSLIAEQIVNDLLDDVLSEGSALSTVEGEEGVRKVLPRRKWKTSAERIASATISALINETLSPKPVASRPSTQDTWLEGIIEELGERLGSAIEEEELTMTSEGESTLGSEDDFNFNEARQLPTIAEYEVGEMGAEFEYSHGESEQPHFMGSSANDEEPNADGPTENLSMRTKGSDTHPDDNETIKQSSHTSGVKDNTIVSDTAKDEINQDGAESIIKIDELLLQAGPGEDIEENDNPLEEDVAMDTKDNEEAAD